METSKLTEEEARRMITQIMADAWAEADAEREAEGKK